MFFEFLVICLTALVASGLTLFSGFGLGTILMPTFAVFFPIPVAVAAAAVVHLANNLFKVGLVGRKADWGVVGRFALPAALAAILGASLVGIFDRFPPLWAYPLGGQIHEVSILKVVIGALIVFFSLVDLLPEWQNMAYDRKYLALGGLLSGFFGGLSGFQGAFRSAFLIRAGLEKEAFIGTGTIAAVIVDIVRLTIYGMSFYSAKFAFLPSGIWHLVLAATVAAFLGAFFGARMIKKVTLHTIQVLIGVMLIIVGLGMASGLI